MTTHTIEPQRNTLHGHFSRDLPPVLTIDSGDTVEFRTLMAGWNIEPHQGPDMTARKFEPRIKGKDDGHALCGPVEIRGAQPGMTLEIQINHIQPCTWGWSCGGGWPSDLNKRLGVADGGELAHHWTLDTDALIGKNQHGHTVSLRPFMGVMGMPPDEPGIHPTWPPRVWGGNLDCKELIAGTTLFLPIAVAGGRFSVGDGHAVQGDGEVSGVAIECPMERVELTFHLRNDLTLSTPRAKTAEGWLTFGLHEDLNEATIIALNAMLDLMTQEHGFHRQEALALASLAVDLRITQIVNGTRGVHAVLPHGAIWG
jgi:acetamidase/formamidase